VKICTGILGFLLILLLLFLTIFFVAGLSYSLSFAFQDENPFIAVINTFMLPLFFVSTALIPYEQIPTGFQAPVFINPFTHIINSLRNLISDHVVDWYQVLFSAGLMAILSVLSFCLAIHCLKNESKQ
jgi:ABC-2 type transport system permease protein